MNIYVSVYFLSFYDNYAMFRVCAALLPDYRRQGPPVRGGHRQQQDQGVNKVFVN